MDRPRAGLSEALARADLDRLVRLVGEYCAASDWEGVVLLRDRCREALERGLQLWPASEYAEYRLALEAPGAFAGPVVVEGAGRFALGPLWEVAASRHQWEELAPHAPPGPARALLAHERVVRGEDLRGDPTIDRGVLEVPLALEAWEPRYPVAVFRADGADFLSPGRPGLRSIALPSPGRPIEDDESLQALVDLVRPWAEQSNGRVAAVVVEGSAAEAIAALGYREALGAPLAGAEAMAWMVWAGASGGAYGRRRGTASGRMAAWWALAALAGCEWPAAPAELGEASAAIRWLVWEPRDFALGWGLHLAGEVPAEGFGFAVAAADARREEGEAAPGPAAGAG